MIPQLLTGATAHAHTHAREIGGGVKNRARLQSKQTRYLGIGILVDKSSSPYWFSSLALALDFDLGPLGIHGCA